MASAWKPFFLGVWQGFCKSQWRSTWKSPAKGPLNFKQNVDDMCTIYFVKWKIKMPLGW
jgi:hypothetical protein